MTYDALKSRQCKASKTRRKTRAVAKNIASETLRCRLGAQGQGPQGAAALEKVSNALGMGRSSCCNNASGNHVETEVKVRIVAERVAGEKEARQVYQ